MKLLDKLRKLLQVFRFASDAFPRLSSYPAGTGLALTSMNDASIATTGNVHTKRQTSIKAPPTVGHPGRDIARPRRSGHKKESAWKRIIRGISHRQDIRGVHSALGPGVPLRWRILPRGAPKARFFYYRVTSKINHRENPVEDFKASPSAPFQSLRLPKLK